MLTGQQKNIGASIYGHDFKCGFKQRHLNKFNLKYPTDLYNAHVDRTVEHYWMFQQAP